MKDLWDKAKAYIEKGDAFLEKGHNKRALNCFIKAFDIQDKFTIEDGSDFQFEFLYTYHKLSYIYYALKDYEQALKYCFKSLFVFEDQMLILGEEYFEQCLNGYSTSLTLLGDIYRNMGKYEEADALPELLEEDKYR